MIAAMIPVVTRLHAGRAEPCIVLTPIAVAIIHLAILVTGLALPADSAEAQDSPAAGTFLVATRNLRSTGFAESIILIIQHDRDGTMGLIINQPTATNAAELLPNITGLDRYDSKLYIGGPVAAWGVIMLVQSARAPANAEHVFDNVYTSGDPELLDQLIGAGTLKSSVRLYAGHAGWSAGQLEAEIRRGSWFTVPARADFVFSNQPQEIWHQLIKTGDRLIVDAKR
jgi:putative transcriptional regulator